MTAIALSYQSQRRPSRLPMLILMAILVAIVAFTIAHAVERHGTVAIEADRLCRSDEGLSWLFSYDKKFSACITKIGDSFWVAIYDTFDNHLVTAFKNRGKVLEKVEEYLFNRGYLVTK